MKRLIQLAVIFLLTGFVISSCSSNLSITKRRYTKGYFVQHHSNKNAETKAVVRNEAASNKKVVNTFAPKLLNEAAAPAQVTPPAPLITAEAAPAQAKAAKKAVKENKVPLSLAITNPVKALNTAAALTRTADAGDDALSLLWVVIVVILIIYLLGLLFDGFGLGNLIHLLAAVALVLLILWLLRII